MRTIKYLGIFFSFFIFLLPFGVWKNSYEGPKVAWFLTGGFLLTIFWLYRSLIKKHGFIFKKVDYLFLGWLLVLLVSSILGIHPLESIIGGSYRHQGVIFFLTLWLIYKTVEIFSSKQKVFLSKGLGIAIIAESVIVILQFMSGKLYFGKPLGTIGEANAVAGFLAIGYIFVYENISSIYFAIPVISILISESRSGILALATSLTPLIKSFNYKLRSIFIFLVIVLSVLFLTSLSTERGSSPFENRPVIWRLGFEQIMERPILGFGAETGEVVYNKAFYKYGFPLSNLIVDRTHNLFLDVAMWSGEVGLVLFSLFLFERFKNIKESSRKFAFISFLVYSMFQPLSVVHWLLFFLL